MPSPRAGGTPTTPEERGLAALRKLRKILHPQQADLLG
jgi:hypothetical protein